jgi:hypothetical protein
MRGKLRGVAAILGLFILMAIAASNPAAAIRLMGSSSTAVYAQKIPTLETPDTFQNQIRLFERLRFDLLDIASPALSFHGFFTSFDDAAHQSIGDTRTRLYNGYLEYRQMKPMRLNFHPVARLGRQWVSSGVGSGTMDGLLLQADQADWGGLTLFGGTLGIDRVEQTRLDSPNASNRLGGEIRVHPRFSDQTEPEVAVSYAVTHRDKKMEASRIGMRGNLRVRRELRLWTEIRHDFALDRTYGTAAGVELLKPAHNLRTWFEYNRRTSDLPATNFFSMFDQRPISSIRGGLGFGVGGPYRIAFDFDRIDFRNQVTYVNNGQGTQVSRLTVDRSKSFRAMLSRGWMEIGARFTSGFGGKQTGLVLSGNQDFGKLGLNVDVDYLKYDYGDNSLEDNDATAGTFAASYQVLPMTRATVQVEALNNRDLKRDVRLLVRVDQRFRLGR